MTTHDNADTAYVKREDYRIDNGRERVRSTTFSLPRFDVDNDFDAHRTAIFFTKERVEGSDWFTTNSNLGVSFRGRSFTLSWGNTS